MGKKKRIKAERLRLAGLRGPLPRPGADLGVPGSGMWQPFPGSSPSAAPRPPGQDDPVWDRTGCPVDQACAGCGTSGAGLRVMLSWFGPQEIACATVCSACDGRSMLHLPGVGLAGLEARIDAHRTHQATS